FFTRGASITAAFTSDGTAIPLGGQLTEGAFLVTGGQQFQITYKGGTVPGSDGNDVVLTRTGRFDANPAGNAVPATTWEAFVPTVKTAPGGPVIGWSGSSILAKDNGAGQPNELLRDMHFDTTNTLYVDVAAYGFYNVTLFMGDQTNPHDIST